MKELFSAFAKFQEECPTIEKNKKGPWGNYADLSQIMTKIRPILSKHGLAVTQALTSDESGTYLNTILTHSSGNEMSARVKIDYEAKNIQQFGSMITYYRRYCLSSILGIVSDDDVDDQASMFDDNHPNPKKKEAPKEIPAKILSTLITDEDKKEFEAKWKNKIDYTDQEQVNNFIAYWKRQRPSAKQ